MKEIIDTICLTIFGIALLYFIYKVRKLNGETIPDDLPEYRNPSYDLTWTSSKKRPSPIVEGKTKSNRKKTNMTGHRNPPPPPSDRNIYR